MRRLIVLAVLVALAPSSARADDDGIERGVDKGTFGVGLIVGEPTGICAKLYLANDKAIQGGVGGAFIGGGIMVYADFVFHPYILQSRDSFVLATYIGPGARVIQYSNGRSSSSIAPGVRGVGGLLFDFKNVPLDAFLEVAGVLEYDFGEGQGAGVALNAGAGIRYYF